MRLISGRSYRVLRGLQGADGRAVAVGELLTYQREVYKPSDNSNYFVFQTAAGADWRFPGTLATLASDLEPTVATNV